MKTVQEEKQVESIFFNTKNKFYLKSTLVETLLTFCPPGPLLQE